MPNEAPAVDADSAVKVENTKETQSAEDWRSALHEDLRDNPTLSNFKDINSLAAAHVNLKSHLGRDKIAKPVTSDDWNDVYNFLGRPESPDGYEVKLPDKIPEPIKAQFNDEALGNFRQKAHELGLNSEQASALVAWQAENLSGQFNALQEQQGQSIEEGEKALRKEWGRGYDQNVKFAHKAFEEYGGEELAALMDQSGLGNNPAVLKAFANIAKSTMADKDLVGAVEGAGRVLTPEEAQMEAKSIMSNPAYTDRRHPEHAGLVKKVQNLFEVAYG